MCDLVSFLFSPLFRKSLSVNESGITIFRSLEIVFFVDALGLTFSRGV